MKMPKGRLCLVALWVSMTTTSALLAEEADRAPNAKAIEREEFGSSCLRWMAVGAFTCVLARDIYRTALGKDNRNFGYFGSTLLAAAGTGLVWIGSNLIVNAADEKDREAAKFSKMFFVVSGAVLILVAIWEPE